MTKKRNEYTKYNKRQREKLDKNLGSLWENEQSNEMINEQTFNSQIEEKYTQSRSYSNIRDGRYVKKLPKDRDNSRNSRDISPNIFSPPDIEALKQRVRNEIRTLDSLKF